MKSRWGRSGFTLAELVVAVAMLAFFSTFIVQMFFKAEQLAEKSRELDMAVVTASEIADQWKRDSAANVMPEILALKNTDEPGQMIKIYFDADFSACDENEAKYVAALILQGEQEGIHEGVRLLRIAICCPENKDEGSIYTLFVGRTVHPEDSHDD